MASKWVKTVTEFNRQQVADASSEQLAEIKRWVKANPADNEDTQELRLLLIEERAHAIKIIRKGFVRC